VFIPLLMVQQNCVYPSQQADEQSHELPGAHSHIAAYALPGFSMKSIGATERAVAVMVVRARKLRREVRVIKKPPSFSVTVIC